MRRLPGKTSRPNKRKKSKKIREMREGGRGGRGRGEGEDEGEVRYTPQGCNDSPFRDS